MSIKQKSEIYFLEGFSSAKGGLALETCPYPYVQSGQDASVEEVTAPVNWRDGWQFGRFVAVQKLRTVQAGELRKAIHTLYRHEAEWVLTLPIATQGLLKGGLGGFRARKKLIELDRQIRQSKEFQLLLNLQVKLYLPFRPSEEPYRFQLVDQQLNVFGNRGDETKLRQLLERFGDRHGVRAAWLEYLHTEPISTMTPDQPKA